MICSIACQMYIFGLLPLSRPGCWLLPNLHHRDTFPSWLRSSDDNSYNDFFFNVDVSEDGNRISQQVYVNACKHLHVTPGKKILRSLTSAQVSAKERIGNKKEVETIAYALTVSSPKKL